MTRPLLFIGTSNLDVVFYATALPERGQSIMGRIEEFGGGKGANQAVAAARLGASPAFTSLLGRDPAGDKLAAMLADAGVDLSRLRRLPEMATGRAIIFVDQHGANMIGIDAGANEAFGPEDVRQAMIGLAEDAVIVAEMGLPLATCRALFTQKGRRFLIFNPAPVRAPLTEADCCAIDILTPNETEAAELTGLPVGTLEEALAAARMLVGLGVRAVAMTLGARGVIYHDRTRTLHQPIFPVKALDTTAAGDAFNGGLATAIARGMDVAQALRFAVAVACLSVTRKGAQASMPSLSDVQEFLKQNGQA